MKLKRNKEEKQFLLAAVIHGVMIGAAGVLLFFFILQAVEKKDGASDKVLPVNLPKSTKVESKSVPFYAMQYGVYSSSQAASDFLAGHPEYESVAIIPADKQFYLWGAISTSEKKIKSIVTKDSFVKPFRLSGAACEEKGLKSIPQLLEVSKVAKLNSSDSQSELAAPVDWKSAVADATKASDKLELVKLMLLEHYVSQNDCLKIEF